MNDTPRPDAAATENDNSAEPKVSKPYVDPCLLYTSDAADD